jgi:hypothetical protein
MTCKSYLLPQSKPVTLVDVPGIKPDPTRAETAPTGPVLRIGDAPRLVRRDTTVAERIAAIRAEWLRVQAGWLA